MSVETSNRAANAAGDRNQVVTAKRTTAREQASGWDPEASVARSISWRIHPLMQDSTHPIGLERIAPATSQSLMPGTYEKFRRRVRFRRRSRQHPRKRNDRRADHPTLSRNLNIRIPGFTGSARQKRCSRSSQSANVNRPPPRGPGQSAADEWAVMIFRGAGFNLPEYGRAPRGPVPAAGGDRL